VSLDLGGCGGPKQRVGEDRKQRQEDEEGPADEPASATRPFGRGESRGACGPALFEALLPSFMLLRAP
jgi:hypothetical protein